MSEQLKSDSASNVIGWKKKSFTKEYQITTSQAPKCVRCLLLMKQKPIFFMNEILLQFLLVIHVHIIQRQQKTNRIMLKTAFSKNKIETRYSFIIITAVVACRNIFFRLKQLLSVSLSFDGNVNASEWRAVL